MIVVTTKKGKAGSNKISYTGEFTMRMKPNYRNFNIMNSQEQMDVYKTLESNGYLTFADVYRASNSGVYGKMYHLINSYDAKNTRFGMPTLRKQEMLICVRLNTEIQTGLMFCSTTVFLRTMQSV